MPEAFAEFEFVGCADFPDMKPQRLPASTQKISLFTSDGLTLCHFVRGCGDLDKKFIFIGRVEYG